MIIAYCIKCGNKFPQEAMFCPYCGTKVYRPEEESSTPTQLPEEKAVESTVVEVVEEPAILNDEVKDFHERLTQVVATKVETVDVPAVQEVVIEPSPEPVKPCQEQVLEPSQKKEEPKPQSVNPNIEQVTIEESSNVEEELEDPSTGGCIIAFFFPMIGFISALCNIGSNKKKAKRYALLAAGGLLVGFISGVIQAL